MARRRRRRLCGSSSSAPAELPDELLWDILLRLPPLPSNLLRASLVWRRLVTDPTFLQRFRASHHLKAGPPLLGFFRSSCGYCSFTALLDPPDRIPAACFSAPGQPPDDICSFFGCRHGLALFLNRTQKEAVVWNPVTGGHCRVPFPPGTDIVLNAAVLRPAGHGDPGQSSPFELVLLCTSINCNSRLTPPVACIYQSESGEWATTGSTTAPHAHAYSWAKHHGWEHAFLVDRWRRHPSS